MISTAVSVYRDYGRTQVVLNLNFYKLKDALWLPGISLFFL